MKPILTVFLGLLIATSIFAGQVTRTPASASCHKKSDSCGSMPDGFTYSIHGDNLTMKVGDTTCQGKRVRKAFEVETQADACPYKFSVMDNGEVTTNTSDGCYAYYSCN